MPNFFPRWTNWFLLKLLLCAIIASAPVVLGIWYYFTPKYTNVGYQPEQPIPFSHALHVKQLGMDCRYCHSFVEVAGHSNLPNTQTCINCHGTGKILSESPRLAPILKSWQTGEPISWVQIHRLPDYAYFNHAVHVQRGISCYSCHGAVNDMEQVHEVKSLSMKWCLECHRSPENYLRPENEVFNMNWHTANASEQRALGNQLKKNWKINPPITCGGCHR